MTSSTILFTDIVGFSLLDTSAQARLIASMSGIVHHEIRDLILPPKSDPEVIALPTGDGMAIAFLRENAATWDFERVMCLATRLFDWADEQRRIMKPKKPIRLRMGIHDGSIEYVRDINGNTNVCGDTINYTQRVMDAANENQLLISERAFEEYLGVNPKACIYNCGGETKFTFRGPYDVLGKHGRRITVYSAAAHRENRRLTAAAREVPRSKNQLLVSLTSLPKEIEGGHGFGPALTEARQVAFIQLTGENLLPKLLAEDVQLSSELERLWVFMPSIETVSKFHAVPPLPLLSDLELWIKRWEQYLGGLVACHPQADIKLGLFDELPFFGASLLDWEKSIGKVHVSPYVWGLDAPDCPGFDVVWNVLPRPRIGDAYVAGLEVVNDRTSNAVSGKK